MRRAVGDFHKCTALVLNGVLAISLGDKAFIDYDTPTGHGFGNGSAKFIKPTVRKIIV